MNPGVKSGLPSAVLLCILISSNSFAAPAQKESEPPVPIYFMQQKNDSKAACSDSLLAQKQKIAEANRKIDSLQSNLQKLSSENSTRSAWHYTIIALLITTVIGLLLLISYIRKETPQTKRG